MYDKDIKCAFCTVICYYPLFFLVKLIIDLEIFYSGSLVCIPTRHSWYQSQYIEVAHGAMFSIALQEFSLGFLTFILSIFLARTIQYLKKIEIISLPQKLLIINRQFFSVLPPSPNLIFRFKKMPYRATSIQRLCLLLTPCSTLALFVCWHGMN